MNKTALAVYQGAAAPESHANTPAPTREGLHQPAVAHRVTMAAPTGKSLRPLIGSYDNLPGAHVSQDLLARRAHDQIHDRETWNEGLGARLRIRFEHGLDEPQPHADRFERGGLIQRAATGEIYVLGGLLSVADVD